MTTLTQLQTLDLSANQLSGTIPDLSTRSPSYRSLNLSANQLSGTIPDLGALSSYTTLNLSDNQLSRPIPDLSDRNSSASPRKRATDRVLPLGISAGQPVDRDDPGGA